MHDDESSAAQCAASSRDLAARAAACNLQEASVEQTPLTPELWKCHFTGMNQVCLSGQGCCCTNALQKRPGQNWHRHSLCGGKHCQSNNQKCRPQQRRCVLNSTTTQCTTQTTNNSKQHTAWICWPRPPACATSLLLHRHSGHCTLGGLQKPRQQHAFTTCCSHSQMHSCRRNTAHKQSQLANASPGVKAAAVLQLLRSFFHDSQLSSANNCGPRSTSKAEGLRAAASRALQPPPVWEFRTRGRPPSL